MHPLLVGMYLFTVGEKYTTKAKLASFQLSSALGGQGLHTRVDRTKITLFYVKLYESGPRVASVVAFSCLAGHLEAAQRQLRDTEVQSEMQLDIAIDDLGFLLSKLKEDSVKPEKMQKKLIRLIEGLGSLFSLGKYDCKQRM